MKREEREIREALEEAEAELFDRVRTRRSLEDRLEAMKVVRALQRRQTDVMELMILRYDWEWAIINATAMPEQGRALRQHFSWL